MSCCEGFRLAAASECSLRSKARIDALFEDSRSVCSSFAGAGPLADARGACCAASDEDQQRRVNSAVQARIEAMFASVEAESAAPGECAAAVLPVKYMGAAPVGGRVASVRGLQEPLRQLLERIQDSVSAELEVSRRGLSFRTSNELHEKTNPFRRIAVWSALKLQARKRQVTNGPTNSAEPQTEVVHAFVPLVADERVHEPVSNASGSCCAASSEDRHAELYRTMRGLAKDVEAYPPIFAVVMRRPGAARLLECHAFACRCEEDAIAAAATLYRALLADLEANARRPRQRNGLGCVSLASVASSLAGDFGLQASSSSSSSPQLQQQQQQQQSPALPPPPPLPPPLPAHQPPPVRPPRAKKTSMSSSVTTEDEQSSSSLCTSGVNLVDKCSAPRRKKKKNSDVKAEDVLEARSRRFCSPSKDQEQPTTERRADNSSSETSSSRLEQPNQTYGSRGGSLCQETSGQVQVIENAGDERSSRAAGVGKSPGGSYEFECCTENSLYESSRVYSKACAPTGQRSKSEQRAAAVAAASGSSTPSQKSTRTTTSSDNNYASQRRWSSSESSAAARHREHFRDADKIYSLGAAALNDEPSGLYDVTRPSRPPTTTSKSSRGTMSSKRLARVATMDRPLRRPGLEVGRICPQPAAQPSSAKQPQWRPSQWPPQQQQQQQQQQQPPPRRRSRAGSEPPSSRTESAAAAAASASSAAAALKRSQSDLDLDRGDLLTRVELPRRSSFLKPGSVRKREGREGGGAGTPLGFTELFDEFRNQEGLTSVDDILAAIIDPEGMSFNELKPLYKEFLLKLAATLTQDELYQRSASIMRRRRRPQRRRSSRGLLRRAIKRSVSRLRSSSTAPTEFTSVVFPARGLNDRSSFASSSSCDAAARRQAGAALSRGGGGRHQGSSSNSNGNNLGRPSNGQHGSSTNGSSRVLTGKLSSSNSIGRRRKRSTATRCSSSKSRLGHTTSEDSDTCRRIDRSLVAANRSSSGYVSCSECSYDSESCTCISADKCYCSLSRRPSQEAPGPPATLLCSCDTDSCSESNKCYCARKPNSSGTPPAADLRQQPSILEQLRQKGIIVPSESTLSRGDSPDRLKSARASRSLATSKSLEYLKVRSPRGSTDNLALDYELFRPGGRRRSSQCSSGSEKVLLVSARDPQGRLIYVGAGSSREDGRRSSRHGQNARHRHGSSAAANGHHEALSIKKSAEIAAVFGAGPHARVNRRTSSASSLRSSVSLEAGLGYLP